MVSQEDVYPTSRHPYILTNLRFCHFVLLHICACVLYCDLTSIKRQLGVDVKLSEQQLARRHPGRHPEQDGAAYGPWKRVLARLLGPKTYVRLKTYMKDLERNETAIIGNQEGILENPHMT